MEIILSLLYGKLRIANYLFNLKSMFHLVALKMCCEDILRGVGQSSLKTKISNRKEVLFNYCRMSGGKGWLVIGALSFFICRLHFLYVPLGMWRLPLEQTGRHILNSLLINLLVSYRVSHSGFNNLFRLSASVHLCVSIHLFVFTYINSQETVA